MGITRNPRRIPMRKFYRKANSAFNPLDEKAVDPVDPRFLINRDGYMVDGRPRAIYNDPYPFNLPIERFPSPPNQSDEEEE
jgi:hypothetical protein